MDPLKAGTISSSSLATSREGILKFSRMTAEAAEDQMSKKMRQLIEDPSITDEERKAFATEMAGFRDMFSAWLRSKTEEVDWSLIKPPPASILTQQSQLPGCPAEKVPALLKKLVVLKLNGGLGTTMGCTGPKAAIEVRGENTFLDLIVHQIEHLNRTYASNVPLVLMNSFNTDADTKKIIQKYENAIKIHTFNQSRYPRILKDSLLPMPEKPHSPLNEWYPPGHGDVFFSFYNSGLLDELMAQGIEYVFVSNVDNLGATVDLQLLHHMDENKIEFAMEVTDKTRADIKGGTLIEYQGRAKLLEFAQVPPSKVQEFKSITKFKVFNTNNLWISLKAIRKVMGQGVLKDMDIIVNHKKAKGNAVIQLERAAGAAIEYFNPAVGINVDRSRFLPVKSTSDLFVIQSNLYRLRAGQLVLDPKRVFPTAPLVKLGDHFTTVSDFMQRFANTPDILELDHLTVSGDVTFGRGVVLKGTVIIVANHGSRIDIPDGTILENKVVSGNLRILEH